MRKILNLIVVIMPWFIKRVILNNIYGYNIHKKAHIGMSYIFPKYLEMAEGARIGNFNIAIHLDKLVIGKNSSISRNNWITGFPTGTNSKHFSHQPNRKCELVIGNESAITKKHHLDCTNSIIIGNFVTVAGYDTQILTHSINIYDGRQDSNPVRIEDYTFVSTKCIILGGSALPSYSILAAGSILNKNFKDKYVLYGGTPAKAIKNLPEDAKYFTRLKGFVY